MDELQREILEHKKRMREERMKIQQQLERMGYHPRTLEEAEQIARKLTIKQ